jgi:hypothetical protein
VIRKPFAVAGNDIKKSVLTDNGEVLNFSLNITSRSRKNDGKPYKSSKLILIVSAGYNKFASIPALINVFEKKIYDVFSNWKKRAKLQLRHNISFIYIKILK